MQMKKIFSILLIFLLVISLVGCVNQENEQSKDKPQETQVVLATTTSTKDSGLLDKLLPVFEEQTGYKVEVISQGTGKALKTGELGDCDVILVHARDAEDKFVADGFGVNRRDVMYNDFVILGPTSDPVGIKGLKVTEALKELAQNKNGKFISRGDNSGTNKKEIKLWKMADIKPEGDWYMEVNKGMGDTLVMTNELQGYTLSDRATYIKMKENLNLEVLVEKEDTLLNPYGVIAINPEKHPEINYEGAMAFIEFITSKEGKKIINNYRVNGQQLFFAE